MVIWGAFWGAWLGVLTTRYGDWDERAFFGAIIGALAGVWLRRAVRKEVDARSAAKMQESQERLSEIAREGREASIRAAQRAAASVAAGGAATRARGAAAAAAESIATACTATPADAPATSRAAWASNESAAADESAVANGMSAASAPWAAPIPAGSAAIDAKPIVSEPVEPSGPNAIEQGLEAARNWILGGNTIVRVGALLLFIGLAFLARYAAASGLFPPELRMATVGFVGVALLVVGFRQRMAKPGFAMVLQGAGVAVMYLTIFAAFRLYTLMPMGLAFGLMVVVCALGCALALLQDSRVLAIGAFAGGFAAPLLLSTGAGNHVALFAYYLVLNLAILFIAYRRSWRVLNVLGFVATFVVAGSWGVLKYQTGHYASTQPFLAAFILIYIFTAVLYARNTPTKLGNAVDSTLVFGTPLVGFGLQAGLVGHFEFGTAFSALAFAFVYIGLALVLARQALGHNRVLVECFAALGVGFATLAVPLALDARWTAGVWALEGAGAFWVGARQARWLPRALGLALQGMAALAFWSTLISRQAEVPLLNASFIGAMLLAIPAALIAFSLRAGDLPHSDSRFARMYASVERLLPKPAFVYAFAAWCFAWLLEIWRMRATPLDGIADFAFDQSMRQLLALLAILASAALSYLLSRRQSWAVAAWPARITLPVMALAWLAQSDSGHRVLDTPAWMVWLVALGIHYRLLRTIDQESGAKPWAAWIHAGSVWLVTALLGDMIWSGISNGRLWSTAWASVVWLVSGVLVLTALALWAGKQSEAWPRAPHRLAYLWTAALPLSALVLTGGFAVAVWSNGRADPLPFIPLLNPTDLTLALALGALFIWRRAVMNAGAAPAWLAGREALAASAALAFVAVNSVWLRVAHHFFEVPWNASDLFQSFVVQTGYSILWTTLALVMMVLAHHKAQRSLWIVGAGLLAVVVLKLLIVDLSNIGGALRIVSFIAVGALMLAVGYFAPIPPAAVGKKEPSA